VRSPLRALSSIIDRVRDRIVVTEGMVDSDEPIMSLCGRAANGIAWSWWHLSVGLYREIFTMAGFEVEKITHCQFQVPVGAAVNHYCGPESLINSRFCRAMSVYSTAAPPVSDCQSFAHLSRFRLASQRIGFLRFAACADSQGVWHGGKVSGYGER
jgi:hypothetical protein